MYFLMTKDLGNGPHLLGVLRRTDVGYEFEYAADIPKEFEIPGLLISHNKHYDDNVKNYILHRVVPESTHMFIKEFLQQENMQEYDEWELLNRLWERFRKNNKQTKYPLHDRKQRVYFYKALPGRYHRFEQTRKN